MFVPKTNAVKKGEGNGLVAIAIDKDKGSQNALKWTIENVVTKGQTVILVHVVHKTPSYHSSKFYILIVLVHPYCSCKSSSSCVIKTFGSLQMV